MPNSEAVANTQPAATCIHSTVIIKLIMRPYCLSSLYFRRKNMGIVTRLLCKMHCEITIQCAGV